jgi:energy-coupling factor transporter ATP-binding protein EcfA2
MDIPAGAFVSILGPSGSGKSTLARILNALIIPSCGTVTVDGLVLDGSHASDSALLSQIRCTVGMVFQNPENQIIGDTVEQDVAFGPENLGLSHNEITARTDDALRMMSLEPLRLMNPMHLSGGQMQRLAIAGVLALRPRYLVLDECLSMLDCQARAEVMDALLRLRKEQGIALIMISHDARDCMDSDHVYVLDKGSVVMEGPAGDILGRKADLKALGIRTC